MTDQPNTETDAEFDARVQRVIDGTLGCSGGTDTRLVPTYWLKRMLARRTVAPAPAGDMLPDLDERGRCNLCGCAPGSCEKPDCPARPAPTRDVEQRVALAGCQATGCGLTVNGEHVLCDHPGASEPVEDCTCRAFARAALSAMPSGRQRGLLEAAEIAEGAAWRHLGDDTYSQGMDAGARHQVDECVKSIRTAAAQLGEPDDGWLPIASAPKDRSNIWLGNSSNIRVGFWSVDTWVDLARSEVYGGPRGLLFEPTHWRLLPPAPSVPR